MGPDGCDKLASFVCLCDSFNLPLLFVHDTPGFYVGKAAEHKRMPGKIMTALQALAMATVPKISLVVRKSYGMAYGNMGGPGMGMDFVFAWPTADISFMAPEVAANVTRRPVEELQRGSTPWRAAGLGYLDDVIAPAESRRDPGARVRDRARHQARRPLAAPAGRLAHQLLKGARP